MVIEKYFKLQISCPPSYELRYNHYKHPLPTIAIILSINIFQIESIWDLANINLA